MLLTPAVAADFCYQEKRRHILRHNIEENKREFRWNPMDFCLLHLSFKKILQQKQFEFLLYYIYTNTVYKQSTWIIANKMHDLL